MYRYITLLKPRLSRLYNCMLLLTMNCLFHVECVQQRLQLYIVRSALIHLFLNSLVLTFDRITLDFHSFFLYSQYLRTKILWIITWVLGDSLLVYGTGINNHLTHLTPILQSNRWDLECHSTPLSETTWKLILHLQFWRERHLSSLSYSSYIK